MIRCIDILTIVAMIVIAGWSLWVRRATWRMPWERHATAATLLSAADMTIGSETSGGMSVDPDTPPL